MFENFDFAHCITRVMDSFLLVYIPFRVFPMRKTTYNKWVCFSLAFLVAAVLLYGIDLIFYPVRLIITLFISISVGMLYACIFYKGQFYLKLIVQSSCLCCTMLSHFILVMSLTPLLGTGVELKWAHILGSAAFSFLIAFSTIHFAVIPKIDLPSNYGIVMAVLMLALALSTDILRTITTDRGSPVFQVGINVMVMVTVLFLTILFFKMVREYEEKSEYILLNQKVDMQKKSLEESMETYNSMRQLRHELKNHMFYMNALLKQEKLEELKNYFNQIYSIEYAFDMIESGNNVINAILNQKSAYAKSKNIRVIINATLPESLDIDESLVCAVISNLFDNAIEACEHLTKPEISMTLRQKGKHFHILCKNTVAYDVLKENALLATTKKTPYHGIGLQVVKSVVNAYDGVIDFYIEDMMFVVNAMLRTN